MSLLILSCVTKWQTCSKMSDFLPLALLKVHEDNLTSFVPRTVCSTRNAENTSFVSVLLYRPTEYIATTTLAIIAVFLEYLGQFLIDLHQIYRHSSVPKNTSPCNFWAS